MKQCHLSPSAKGSTSKSCPKCNGVGMVTGIQDSEAYQDKCSKCNGTGKIS